MFQRDNIASLLHAVSRNPSPRRNDMQAKFGTDHLVTRVPRLDSCWPMVQCPMIIGTWRIYKQLKSLSCSTDKAPHLAVLAGTTVFEDIQGFVLDVITIMDDYFVCIH